MEVCIVCKVCTVCKVCKVYKLKTLFLHYFYNKTTLVVEYRKQSNDGRPTRHAELVSASPYFQGIAGQARNDGRSNNAMVKVCKVYTLNY